MPLLNLGSQVHFEQIRVVRAPSRRGQRSFCGAARGCADRRCDRSKQRAVPARPGHARVDQVQREPEQTGGERAASARRAGSPVEVDWRLLDLLLDQVGLSGFSGCGLSISAERGQ